MFTRREMILTVAATTRGLAASSLLASPAFALSAPLPRPRFWGKLGKLQILQVGVDGSIAPADRSELTQHPDVVFSGLCDVDSDALASVSKEHPNAFTCRDFREAIDKHRDKFDAVVVCTPDHNHALIDLTALAAGKHVWIGGPPEGKWPDAGTLVVCEGGALFVQPEGPPTIWIGGKEVDFKSIPGQGVITARNHWHSWVDVILGKSDAFVESPFSYSTGIAEAGLLCAKAARFPNQELRWKRRRSPLPTMRKRRRRLCAARTAMDLNCRRLCEQRVALEGEMT